MSNEGFIVSIVMTAVIGLWLVLPFMRRHQPSEPAPSSALERQRERVRVYYERVLRNIRDLDEDFATGKLARSDYDYERERWVARGIQALKVLDSIDSEHLVAPSSADDATLDAMIDENIEHSLLQDSAQQG